jgi:predicted permease
VENLLRDLGFGVRLLRRRPAFTAFAVLLLALGIGLSTVMFNVVNAVLLAPTAVHEPERLAELYTSQLTEVPFLTISYPDFLDLRSSTDAFSGMAGHAMVRGLFRSADSRAEIVLGEVVNESYFDVLGIRPVLGRVFSPEENLTELTHPVVVLSHGFWQRRLGGDPEVLGRSIELSGVVYTVVGVAGPHFAGTIPGLSPEFWAPLMMVEKLSFSGIQSQAANPPPGSTRNEQRGTRWLFVTARLAPGRSLEEARAQVETVGGRLAAQHPDENKNLKATVLAARSVRFHPMVDGMLAPAAGVLMGAVGLVLLVACANVASMLLARAAGRRREIAVRLAIGADRGRLVRQLLAESLCLAALGGAAGLLLAFWGSRLLSAVELPLPVPLAFSFGLDGRVLTFATLASLLTATFFGLVPALQASRPDLVPALRGESGAVSAAHRSWGPLGLRFPLRHVLVTGQLALSLVLLVAGALLVRALAVADRIPPGFEPERLAVLSFNLAMNGYSQDQATAFQRRLVERVRGVPGVERVSLVSRPPLGSDQNMEGILLPGQHGPDDEPALVDATSVEPDYFAALGVPILEGRSFADSDTQETPGVVVVNETMARRFWPGRSPLGERVYTLGFDKPAHEVVGVVRDYKVRQLGEAPRPYLHFAWRQQQSRYTTVVARTSGPAAAAVASLRQAVLGLEPTVVFSEEGTASDLVHLTLGPTRMAALLLGAFGALALLLAAVGLYGVVAYTVEQRTREMGLRMALGARMGDVLRLVLGQGMRLAVVGIVVGGLAAAALARVLSALLYGVSALDPLAYGGAVVLLLAVAFAANWVPARRAARINPMVALRGE